MLETKVAILDQFQAQHIFHGASVSKVWHNLLYSGLHSLRRIKLEIAWPRRTFLLKPFLLDGATVDRDIYDQIFGLYCTRGHHRDSFTTTVWMKGNTLKTVKVPEICTLILEEVLESFNGSGRKEIWLRGLTIAISRCLTGIIDSD
jgi:hypothetical protein